MKWSITASTVLGGLLLLGGMGPAYAGSGEFREDFDGDETSWRFESKNGEVRLLGHQRQEKTVFAGRRAEALAFSAESWGRTVGLVHRLPAARVFGELTLSVRVRSNQPGAMLFARVVFPRQTDPRTGETLTTLLEGDTYDRPGDWQELRCATTEEALRKQVIYLRALLGRSEIDTHGAYVDRAVVQVRPAPGRTVVFLDEMRFGPVVDPPEGSTAEDPGSTGSAPPVEFRLDRLTVDGRPFLPRLIPYHGESPESLSGSGVNVVWVPHYDDFPLLKSLRRAGLWATATAPQPVSESGRLLGADRAGIVPFSRMTRPILMWYAGTRIPPEATGKLRNWCRQIRSADPDFQRPVMADVTDNERVFSRHVEMLGTSRHVLGTNFSLKQYRDWLLQKHELTFPGTFRWTWLQTEASSSRAQRRKANGRSPIVVEPEQIRLQAYAALSAGCRGLGYWTRTPLDAEAPGAEERRLAMAQLNLELELLEPLLAEGKLSEDTVSFRVKPPEGREIGRRRLDFRTSAKGRRQFDALMEARTDRTRRQKERGRELEAAVIRQGGNVLLLPVWYQHGAQFVPGQAAANDATFVVPGADESASAWEVTPTGLRGGMDRERVTGGLKIRLRKFNQTSAILLTADRQLLARLRARIRKMAPKSARLSIDLARAKLERVRGVDQELSSLGVGQPDAPQILAQTRMFLEEAETAYQRADYQSADELSANAMQLLRILQRAHWREAVRNLTAPTSSPHTLCFQTLPDHWRMVKRIGRGTLDLDRNLLLSGDFEDIDTMVGEGWEHSQDDVEGIRATAGLYAQGHQGRYALRLAAGPEPGTDPPMLVRGTPVTVQTPPVTVRRGQIVHITGWVRVPGSISRSLDGAVLYDSIGGRRGALRWRTSTDWERFALVREVDETGELRLTIALNGLGEIHFDDLRIIPQDAPSASTPADEEGGEQSEENRGNRWDLLERLPGIGG